MYIFDTKLPPYLHSFCKPVPGYINPPVVFWLNWTDLQVFSLKNVVNLI